MKHVKSILSEMNGRLVRVIAQHIEIQGYLKVNEVSFSVVHDDRNFVIAPFGDIASIKGDDIFLN